MSGEQMVIGLVFLFGIIYAIIYIRNYSGVGSLIDEVPERGNPDRRDDYYTGLRVEVPAEDVVYNSMQGTYRIFCGGEYVVLDERYTIVKPFSKDGRDFYEFEAYR